MSILESRTGNVEWVDEILSLFVVGHVFRFHFFQAFSEHREMTSRVVAAGKKRRRRVDSSC